MNESTPASVLRAVAVSGSPSRDSRSRRLLAHAMARLGAAGAETRILDLSELPADDLLGRTHSSTIAAALSEVDAAHVLVIGTPVYRASYSGLLKVFFDLLTPDALAQKVAIVVATGAGPAHQLVIDHGLRPLLASVGALVVSTGVYGTDAQFGADGPDEALRGRVDRAVTEALTLAGSLSSPDVLPAVSHPSR
jgi:FMN reductase